MGENTRIMQFWSMSQPEESLGNGFLKAFQFTFDNLHNAKNESISNRCRRGLILCAKRWDLAGSIASWLVRILKGEVSGMDQNFSPENTGKCVGKLISLMIKKDDDNNIPKTLLFELKESNLGTASGDKNGPRICQNFLEVLGESCPKFMYQQMALLEPHLGRDPWQCRAAVLFGYARIIKEKILDVPTGVQRGEEEQKEAESKKKQKKKILEILEERSLDASPYARSRVLKQWIELVKGRVIPATFLSETLVPMTVKRLCDRNSNVRQASMDLLSTIILHNPFDCSGSMEFDVEKQSELLAKMEAALTKREEESRFTKEQKEIMETLYQ